MQFINVYFGSGIYGKFYFGMSARNPGLFLYPAASAFLIIMLSYVYCKDKIRIGLRPLLMFYTSILLCASITGILGAAVLTGIFFKKLSPNLRITAGALVVFSFFYLHSARMSMIDANYLRGFMQEKAPEITVPVSKSADMDSTAVVAAAENNHIEPLYLPAYLRETGGGRLAVLVRAFNSATLWPVNFGVYTNAAVNHAKGIIADSQIASALGNLGFFWFGIFCIFFLAMIAVNYKQRQKIGIFVIIIVCSFGLNVSETGLAMLLAIVGRYTK